MKKHSIILITSLIVLINMSSKLMAQDRLSTNILELIAHTGDPDAVDPVNYIIQNQQLKPTRSRDLSRKIIGYLPYWEYEHYDELNFDLLSQINFFSLELDAQGEIGDSHGWPLYAMVDLAHEHEVSVTVCATLFGSDELTTLLSNSLFRENAVSNLVASAVAGGADGIDIDFELLPFSQRENLVIFMQSLREELDIQIPNAVLSMATPAVDWSGAWDLDSLAAICDALFVMGYNYHYSGSSTAGPVAPLGGFFYDLQYTVEDYLYVTNDNREKIVLGLPYYGLDWPVLSSEIYAPTLGTGISRTYNFAMDLAGQYIVQRDESTATPYISYHDSEWRQCWFDDSLSLAQKYQYADDMNLAGIGIWALGYDSQHSELWDALADQFLINTPIGDVNEDALLNILDILQILSFILGGLEFSDHQIFQADVNQDLTVDILDVVQIVHMIMSE